MARRARVRLLNRQRKLRLDGAALRTMAERILDEEGTDPGASVEIVFVRDAAIARLNEAYRGRPGATDVLSFPTDVSAWPDGETPLLGSVVVSVDRAEAQAQERSLVLDEEIRRLAAHGLLHLLGYDDQTPRERATMRRRERRYLGPRSARR